MPIKQNKYRIKQMMTDPNAFVEEISKTVKVLYPSYLEKHGYGRTLFLAMKGCQHSTTITTYETLHTDNFSLRSIAVSATLNSKGVIIENEGFYGWSGKKS
ncbi:MAG: hypothetical protein H6940_06575 [Burkholderiales bacterium]|nr:hypothetical protein [Burkholderiales bacterium]